MIGRLTELSNFPSPSSDSLLNFYHLPHQKAIVQKEMKSPFCQMMKARMTLTLHAHVWLPWRLDNAINIS